MNHKVSKELANHRLEQAKEQLLEYCNLERIKNIPNLKKYTVVAVVDELYVNELFSKQE